MADAAKVCSKCGETYAADVIFCPKDGTPLGSKKTEVVEDPYLGLTLAGQFELRQLIGIGAMGRVYRAFQAGIDRDVAVKILHRELMMNSQLIARFHREAKVASRLAHPNVVQVLMTGELDKDAEREIGGEAYLVMEYLDGISLRSALAAAGGALPLPRALHVMLQVCDAVGEAHTQGIVHRDLKPENVMLVKRGDDMDFVKVLDFGVARMDWADSSVATQAGVIFGTARYISPEGAQGEKVGAPGDVYSIATLLYQCLSGQTPFDAENPVAILVKQTSEPAPPLRLIARSSYVPEPVARVVEANLAKKPTDRARDARELGRALVEAARDGGLSPDDLLLSSTLLGGSRALQLQSIERTKSLNLTPELADQMMGKTSVDSADTIAESGGRTTVDHGPGGTRIVEPDRPSKPHSNVEPTLAGEPADEVVSATRNSVPNATPTTEPPVSAPRSTEAGPTSAPPSFPDNGPHSRASYAEVPRTPLPRWLVIAACFVVGVGLSIGVAAALGTFDTPDEPTVDSYARRAQAAVEARAWDSPPGENVRDITESALRRWPDAEPIVRVRRDAARRLAEQAESMGSGQAERATELAQLALDFDPGSERAQSVLRSLEGPPQVVEPEVPVQEPETVTKKRPVPKIRTPRKAITAPPAVDAGTPPEPAGDPEDKPGGRWL